MAYRLAFMAAVVAAWLATPSAANHHCLTPTIKSVADNATRAVQCINEWQREVTKPRDGVRTDGGIQTQSSVVALAGSIGVAVARFAQNNAPDGECRTAYARDVRNLRPTYDSAVRAAMQVSGGSLDVRTINELTTRCRVDSQILGEIAEYGIRPSGGATAGVRQRSVAHPAAASATSRRSESATQTTTAEQEHRGQCLEDASGKCFASWMSARNKLLADAPEGAKALAEQVQFHNRELARLRSKDKAIEATVAECERTRCGLLHTIQMEEAATVKELLNHHTEWYKLWSQLQREFPDFMRSVLTAEANFLSEIASSLPPAEESTYGVSPSSHSSIAHTSATSPAGTSWDSDDDTDTSQRRNQMPSVGKLLGAAVEGFDNANRMRRLFGNGANDDGSLLEAVEVMKAVEDVWEDGDETCACRDDDDMPTTGELLDAAEEGLSNAARMRRLFGGGANDDDGSLLEAVEVMKAVEDVWEDGDETCACRDDDDMPTTGELLDAAEEGRNNVNRIRRLFGR